MNRTKHYPTLCSFMKAFEMPFARRLFMRNKYVYHCCHCTFIYANEQTRKIHHSHQVNKPACTASCKIVISTRPGKHIKPVQNCTHWLPISRCIDYKTVTDWPTCAASSALHHLDAKCWPFHSGLFITQRLFHNQDSAFSALNRNTDQNI